MVIKTYRISPENFFNIFLMVNFRLRAHERGIRPSVPSYKGLATQNNCHPEKTMPYASIGTKRSFT